MTDQKTMNETYFASLGQANATRPADLPPSQGGLYQGFGSTPSPSASHPSYGLSSASAPSLSDLQENPMAALSKGWSLFSAAVAGASRVVSENVIQPGLEKVTDPTLQASVKGYVSEAQKRATIVGSTANQWSKSQFGVDVAGSVGGVVGTVKEKMGGGPKRDGYGAISNDLHDGEGSALYGDEEDEHNFFGEFSNGRYDEPSQHNATSSLSQSTVAKGPTTTTAAAPAKKNDWDDEWKDF